MITKCRLLLVVAAAMWPAFGQQTPDRLTIAVTDPSRPATVKAHLVNGSISVRTHNGKDVIVQARTRESGQEARHEGMRRIPMTATGLEAEEENNVVNVSASLRTVDLEIEVPVRTSLSLKTVNNGDITVQGVHGEIEVEDVNGSVTLTDIAGAAVAHALNGRLVAKFTQVDPQKPMSFSSLNGAIDVTFPADLKANVKLKSDRGEVYSDFEIAVKPSPQPIVEGAREGKGKYRVRVDRTVYGTVNGGGQEIQFSNFNGSIYIRQAGK